MTRRCPAEVSPPLLGARSRGADRDEPGSAEAPAGIPLRAVVLYALPGAPLGFMAAIAAMYLLKFASDVLLVAPALFSSFFAISKVFDALSDPLIGYGSDRTRRALGRRRPWMLAAIVPIVLTFWAVWSPPAGLDPSLSAWWVGVAIIAYYLAYSAAAVPHLALGAELSPDYHERTRIFGARAALEFIGLGLAAAAMAWLQTSDDPRRAAQAMTLLFGATLGIALTWGSLATPERPEHQGRPMPPPIRAVSDVARNPHARLVVLALSADTLSFNLLAAIFPFIAAYTLPDDALSGSYVVSAIAFAVLMFPVWPLLARRYGKRRAWLVALGMRVVGFVVSLLAVPDAMWLAPITLVLVGGSLPCTFIVAPSIKSDVIDYDELVTGDRKEGSYFAIWNLIQKLAAGLAVGIAGVALSAAGYEANAEQSPAAIRAMLLLFSGLPICLHALAIVLVARMGLDEDEHRRVRAELARRRSGSPAGEAVG